MTTKLKKKHFQNFDFSCAVCDKYIDKLRDFESHIFRRRAPLCEPLDPNVTPENVSFLREQQRAQFEIAKLKIEKRLQQQTLETQLNQKEHELSIKDKHISLLTRRNVEFGLPSKCTGCQMHWDYLEESGKCIFCNNSTQNLRKEIIVKMSFEAFGETFDVHDAHLGVSKVRPDLLNYKHREYAVCVCVDENQHCHETEFDRNFRMHKIGRALKKPVWFLRFNPDSFVSLNEKCNLPYEEKFTLLYSTYLIIKNQIVQNPEKHNYCIFLYYNDFDRVNIKVYQMDQEKSDEYSQVQIPYIDSIKYNCIEVFEKYLHNNMK